MIKYLLNNGADPNYGLNSASNVGDFRTLKYLYRRGATLTNQVYVNSCYFGNLEMVKYIEKRINVTYNSGLFGACNSKNINLVKYILDKDSSNVNTVLWQCVQLRNYDIIRLLFKYGANSYNHLDTIDDLELYTMFIKYTFNNNTKSSI